MLSKLPKIAESVYVESKILIQVCLTAANFKYKQWYLVFGVSVFSIKYYVQLNQMTVAFQLPNSKTGTWVEPESAWDRGDGSLKRMLWLVAHQISFYHCLNRTFTAWVRTIALWAVGIHNWEGKTRQKVFCLPPHYYLSECLAMLGMWETGQWEGIRRPNGKFSGWGEIWTSQIQFCYAIHLLDNWGQVIQTPGVL